MKELELSVQDIRELMEAFSRSKMGSFKLKQGDFSLKLEANRTEQVLVPSAGGVAAPAPTVSEPVAEETGIAVNSPIVGTFYAAPAPDKEPYVRVGSKVKKGDVLFIIESMKLMNEVTSEVDGTVARIVVENAQPVEYGQPVLYVE